MTVREQLGRLDAPPFLDRLATGEQPRLPAEVPDLAGYIELALLGGFPDPVLRLMPPARTRWLSRYGEQLVAGDAIGVEPRRDPVRLRRYLEAYALNTAGVVDDKTLVEATGVNHKTAIA